MASIGSAALILTTEATKLYSGLDEAKSKVKGFADGIGSQVSGAMAAFPVAGAITGGLSSAFSSIGPVIQDTVDRLKELTTVGRQAKSIGVASDQFMGLTQAAKSFGVEGDEMFHMLTKLSETTYKAGTGNKELSKTLTDMGVNMTDLQSKSPDQKFLAIADALSKVSDPAQRTHDAMELFGKSGFRMLPMLDQGKAGLEKLVSKMKEMGVALNDADMSKLEKARAALPKIGQAFEGMKNKVLVAISPLIEKIGGGITKAIDFMLPWFDKAARVITVWGSVIGDVFSEIGNWIQGGIDEVKSWFGSWEEIKANFPTVEQIALAALQGIGRGFAYLMDVTKAVGGVMALAFHPVLWALDMMLIGIKNTLDGLAKITGSENKWGQDIGKWEADLEKFRKDTDKWGADAIDNAFSGKTAKKVDDWFDKIRNKKIELNIVPKIDPNAISKLAADTKLPTLQAEGSAEAYKTTVEYQWQGMMKKQNDQLQAAKDGNAKLDLIKAGIDALKQTIKDVQMLQVA